MPDPRTQMVLADALHLAATHRPLERAAAVAGPFTISWRRPGFGTLCHLILEQQVSIDAARAMYRRLERRLGTVEPAGLLALDDATLRQCGFTRQKSGYARDLARRCLDGTFSFGELERMDDASATSRLVELRGVGPWTAANYLLWAEGRRDVLPPGDLALRTAWAWLHDSEGVADDRALSEAARSWAPRRTAAAFLLWHCYLAVRGRTAPA